MWDLSALVFSPPSSNAGSVFKPETCSCSQLMSVCSCLAAFSKDTTMWLLSVKSLCLNLINSLQSSACPRRFRQNIHATHKQKWKHKCDHAAEPSNKSTEATQSHFPKKKLTIWSCTSLEIDRPLRSMAGLRFFLSHAWALSNVSAPLGLLPVKGLN